MDEDESIDNRIFCCGCSADRNRGIPVYESGTFRIAVSRRHRDFVHITNPSSVFGDKIIPVDIAGIENINAGKIRIYADSVNDELVVSVQETDINGSNTEKKNTVWERVKC